MYLVVVEGLLFVELGWCFCGCEVFVFLMCLDWIVYEVVILDVFGWFSGSVCFKLVLYKVVLDCIGYCFGLVFGGCFVYYVCDVVVDCVFWNVKDYGDFVVCFVFGDLVNVF